MHPAMRRGIVALLEPAAGVRRLVRRQSLRAVPHAVSRDAVGLDGALIVSIPNQKTRPDGWNGPLGPQPATLRVRLAGDAHPRPGADLGRPRRRSSSGRSSRQLGHESPLVRYAACRALGRVGGRAAIAGLARCLGDESKVVRRAAAEALRLMGNRLNGSHRPGETEAQVQLVAELREALRSPDDRTRRGATRVFAAHFRELSQEPALADVPARAARRSRSGRRDAGDQGVVAVVVLAGRSELEESDRGPSDRRAGRAAASLGPPQPDRGPLHHRRREHPLPGQELDSVAGQAEDSRQRATAAQHATVNRLGSQVRRRRSRAATGSSARACSARCRSSSSGPCWVAGSATTWSRCCSTATSPARSRRP